MKTGRKTKAQLVKELEALRKINATIGTLLDLNAVLQRIIDEIVPLFAAQAASVILFDSGPKRPRSRPPTGRKPCKGNRCGILGMALFRDGLRNTNARYGSLVRSHMSGQLQQNLPSNWEDLWKIFCLLAPLWSRRCSDWLS